jgi:hypothetical protein
MLIQYFKSPSRIEELHNGQGGHLLEGFAQTLCQSRYQWVAARKHIRAAEHFIHWMGHRGLSITAVEERFARVPQSLKTMPMSGTPSTTETSLAKVQCRSLVRLFAARWHCPDSNFC